MDTKEKFTQLLIEETLGNIEKQVDEKLESAEMSFIAKLDGLKTRLNSKIDDISNIIEQKPFTVNFGTIETPKSEVVHKSFMTVLNILKSQKRNPKNIMLVGEAGSGKTHLASCVAKALGLKFYPFSVGLQTTKSDLLGFINAHGQYVTSPLREAFEKGGVLLLDEFDSAHAGVVTIINSLLANGHCSFPDGIIEKNDKFICLVACNTYGHGANIDYVGRNRLDGATLDRFITVHVGYDEKLEEVLTCNPEWLSIVKQIRKNIEGQGIKMIVSPRASMNGADLLDAGFSIEEVLDMTIMKGADADTKQRLMKGINLKGGIVEPKKEYKRNTEKYEVIEIRTEYENFDKIVEIKPITKKLEDENWQETIDCSGGHSWGLHVGHWSHEYDGYGTIFFNVRSSHRCSSLENDYLSQFFNELKKQGEIRIDCEHPIVFEFVKKGCKKPYDVITLERE